MPYKHLSAEYKAYHAAKSRCLNPQHRAYPYYGGRGITFDSQWAGDFYLFLNHIGKKPAFDAVLDRIDNDKGYIPGNVRWTTASNSQRNRRHDKNTYSLCQGVRYCSLTKRWLAKATKGYKQIHLYSGPDFFLAICARKSWENQNVGDTNMQRNGTADHFFASFIR